MTARTTLTPAQSDLLQAKLTAQGIGTTQLHPMAWQMGVPWAPVALMGYVPLAAMVVGLLLLVYVSLYSVCLMTPYLYLADPALPSMVIGAFNLRDLIRLGRQNVVKASLRDLAVIAVWAGANLAILWIGHGGSPSGAEPGLNWTSIAVVTAFGLFDAAILYRRAGGVGRQYWRQSWREARTAMAAE
jgi:hypothetical protein